MTDLSARLDALRDHLLATGSVLIAFSGGCDSAFLLTAAVRALGADRVAAATAVSASLPQSELTQAREFATRLGVRHLTPATLEMSRPDYRANGRDRCFHCKAELLDVLVPLADDMGFGAVATGTNADDAADPFRPGIRAAAERGAITPLRDAGLTKQQVREASRHWGLTTADKPAAACLSSRVAYGLTISSARLGRVERAESDLRQAMTSAGLGVRNLRVRDLGDVARIEVDQEFVGALRDAPSVTSAVQGFVRIEVDPVGFRSGSMNEVPPSSAPQESADVIPA